jgi:hypothetical protein
MKIYPNCCGRNLNLTCRLSMECVILLMLVMVHFNAYFNRGSSNTFLAYTLTILVVVIMINFSIHFNGDDCRGDIFLVHTLMVLTIHFSTHVNDVD